MWAVLRWGAEMRKRLAKLFRESEVQDANTEGDQALEQMEYETKTLIDTVNRKEDPTVRDQLKRLHRRRATDVKPANNDLNHQ